MAIYSSILTWKIPWTEEHGGLQPKELQKSQVQLETKEQTTATIILLNNTNYAFENYDTH